MTIDLPASNYFRGSKPKSKIIDLLLILTVIAIACFLFRGSQDHGLSFDEVFRRNNLIPFFNAEAQPYNQSIYNFPKTKIPLIYKNYISSMQLLPELIWVGFDDYRYGLRLSYLIYFILGALVLYAGLRTVNQPLAFWSTLLAITNPMLFPECRYGFANPIHFFFIGLLVYLTRKYLLSDRRPSYLLFLISLVLFLLPNFIFYSWWIVAAVIISAIVLYPSSLFNLIKQPLNILAIGAGFLFGHFNFILYNLFRDFPSIRPLYNFIFHREKYNEKPIDYSESAGFLGDLTNKFKMFQAQFEISITLLMMIVTLGCLSYFIIIYYLKKQKDIHRKWIYFAPLVLVLTLIFILLSPNAHRSGHFIFLSPTWEIALAIIALKISYLWPKFKLFPMFSLLAISLINFNGANSAVIKANETLGEGHFSPAFYNLNHYINDKGIKHKLVHLHWGFYAQLYFLNRGEIISNSLVFNLINNPSEEDTFRTFDAFFSDPIITSLADPIYFPLFTDWHQFTVEKFKKYIAKRGWTLELEKEFLERNKKPIFNLYRLTRDPEMN